MTSSFPAVHTFTWSAVRKNPLSIELFTDFKALFYPNGKKVLPADSVELTLPWFASMYVDDGSLQSRCTVFVWDSKAFISTPLKLE